MIFFLQISWHLHYEDSKNTIILQFSWHLHYEHSKNMIIIQFSWHIHYEDSKNTIIFQFPWHLNDEDSKHLCSTSKPRLFLQSVGLWFKYNRISKVSKGVRGGKLAEIVFLFLLKKMGSLIDCVLATCMRYFHIFLSLYWTWFGDAHDLMTGMYLGDGHRQ